MNLTKKQKKEAHDYLRNWWGIEYPYLDWVEIPNRGEIGREFETVVYTIAPYYGTWHDAEVTFQRQMEGKDEKLMLFVEVPEAHAEGYINLPEK